MSGTTDTWAETVFGGPPSNYPAAAASSSSAQSLITGASGDYVQPVLPARFFQQGRQNQVVTGILSGIISGQGSATTAIITLGLATSSNTISGTTLVAAPAITVTSLSSAGWWMDFVINCRGSGYGTSSVSSTMLSACNLSCTGASGTTSAPNSVTTIDSSVTQWLYASVTFSTSSVSNSCTLQIFDIFGMN
jgi:hypothetical protein